MPGAQHLGVERLAGGDQPAQGLEPPQLRPLGDHAVLGRRHAERVDLLALEDLEPLVGVEARVVQQRGGALQPRGDEHVAGRLRPARGRRAPRQPVGRRRQPVLGLHALAGQVALAVEHRLGLAGRAGGEGDEARVLVGELDGGHRLGGGQLRPGHDEHVGVGRRLAEHAEVALVAHHQPRLRDRQPGAQVARAQLLGARQHDGADAEAGEHGQDPLGPVADQRHHDVAAADPAGGQRARRAGRRLGHLAEAPLRPRAVAAERDERPPRGRGGVDHVAREVHRGRRLEGSFSDQLTPLSNGVRTP